MIRNFIKEVFLKNKSKLVECVERNDKINYDLIMNEKKFQGFEDFLLDYFDNSEFELNKVINFVLYQDYPFHIHPLFKAMELENLQDFERIKNLYVKYKTIWQQLQDVFMKNFKYFDLFINMRLEMRESCMKFLKQVFNSNKDKILEHFNRISHPEIIQIITNEDSFELFEDLISGVDFVGGFSLSKSNMISSMLMKSIQSENLNTFKRIRNFYTNFKKSWGDIQDILITQKIFPEIFFFIKYKICQELCDFTKEIFNSNKNRLNLLFQNYRDENFNLIFNEQIFNLFEEFVVKICDNDEELIKQIIGAHLFYEYSSSFHPLLIAIRSNNLQTFEGISNIYIKYKKSNDELQNFLISDSNFLKCFENMSYQMCANVTEYFEILFKNDKTKLINYLKNQSINSKLNLNEQEKLNLIHFLNIFLKDLEHVNDVVNIYLL